MRQDQIQRLRDLSEQLADTFLMEADPVEWPGSGRPPADLTQQERGDAYWCKKNAMATGGVLRYTLELIDRTGPAPQEGEDADALLDRQIRDAEKRAAAAMQRVVGKAKAAFDERVHGKAQG